MSLMVYARRLYNNIIGSDNIVYGVLPTSATDVAAAAFLLTAGVVAWRWNPILAANSTNLIPAANVPIVEFQIVGITFENFVAGAGAQGEVMLLVGAAGADVEVARFQVVPASFTLPKPIRVQPTTRIGARFRTSTGVADTVDVKLNILTGF